MCLLLYIVQQTDRHIFTNQKKFHYHILAPLVLFLGRTLLGTVCMCVTLNYCCCCYIDGGIGCYCFCHSRVLPSLVLSRTKCSCWTIFMFSMLSSVFYDYYSCPKRMLSFIPGEHCLLLYGTVGSVFYWHALQVCVSVKNAQREKSVNSLWQLR